MRIGISGWNYAPWRGVFYPKELPHKSELNFASRQFNSIELNGSFYSLQRPSSFARWYAETPPGFVFSVKGPRFITHMKKLREVEVPLANFLGSGLLALREKLGPILWQFPPNLRWDETRFRDFFEMLPRTTREAARISKNHNEKLKHGACTTADADRPMRHAIEIRHTSFLVPEFFALLREFGIAFVLADTAGKWPYVEDFTADFVYIRLHGDEELYVSGYSAKALDWWAERIRLWRKGRHPKDARLVTARNAMIASDRDVYVYFDNDAKVHAPFDAQRLRERLRR